MFGFVSGVFQSGLYGFRNQSKKDLGDKLIMFTKIFVLKTFMARETRSVSSSRGKNMCVFATPAAGEKKRVFLPAAGENFWDFSTLTKDLDTPPVGGSPL